VLLRIAKVANETENKMTEVDSWIRDFSIVHIINQCSKFNNFIQKTGRKDFGGVSIMHDGH
jgi:hypothetical protein